MKLVQKRFFFMITILITLIILFFTIFQSGLVNSHKMMQLIPEKSLKVKGINPIGTMEYSSVALEFKELRGIDHDNDNNTIELYILVDEGNCSIEILKSLPSGLYELADRIKFTYNITAFEVGYVNKDKFPDIIYSQKSTVTGDISVHFQNNITNTFTDTPNLTETISSFPIDDLEPVDFTVTGQMDILEAHEGYLSRIFYNVVFEMFDYRDFISIYPGSQQEPLTGNKIRCTNIDGNPPYQNEKEILLYGWNKITNNSYFILIRKDTSSGLLNQTFEEYQLSGKPVYTDLQVADLNGDLLPDIIAVNETGISLYYQSAGSGDLFNTQPDQVIPHPNLKQIRLGLLNDDLILDILVHDGSSLFIYYGASLPDVFNQQIFTTLSINDMQIIDLDNNGLDDVVIVGGNGTLSQLWVFYQEKSSISEEKNVYFVIGATASGALAGASAASSALSPGVEIGKLIPSSGGDGGEVVKLAGVERQELEIGMKRPGKWYHRKRAKMYISSVGIGAILSFFFLFLFYPIALASSWLVGFGSVIAPIGLFYGTYDFLYVGLYEHKGNLWTAYYKGKKKFFWDVFSWAKPILTAVCIFTTIDMFLILTSYNWSWTGILLGILFSGMITLLLLSIFVFKVGKESETKVTETKPLL
ncbi:MAG: hypothetical protein ACFFD2_24105 [Promethearchaeota archaeon]